MVYHTPTPSLESRRRTGHECRHFPFLTREQAHTCGNTNSIIRDDHLHRNITIDLGSRRPSASTLDSMQTKVFCMTRYHCDYKKETNKRYQKMSHF